MPKGEKKILQLLQKNILVIAFFIALVFSVVLRMAMMNNVSRDMEIYLLPWMQELTQKGFGSLRDGVGNYNSPYLLLMLLGTKLSIQPVHAIKLYSIIADYVLAGGLAAIVYTLRKNSTEKSRIRWAGFTFLFFCFFPIIVLNSAYWGQCDSIYGAFAVWSLYCLLKNKYGLSFLWFGLGLCFKLQIIFLLPFYIIIYFINKKFTIAWFLTLPAFLLATGIPSAIQGGSIFFGYDVYFGQTVENEDLFFNYPNATALIKDANPDFFSVPLMIATVLFFMGLLVWLLVIKADLKGDSILLLAAISVLGAVYLLPHMHERYGFVGEILLWAWFFVNPKINRLVPALTFTYTGLSGYTWYLFGVQQMSEQILATINLIMLGYLVWRLVVEVPKQEQNSSQNIGTRKKFS